MDAVFDTVEMLIFTLRGEGIPAEASCTRTFILSLP